MWKGRQIINDTENFEWFDGLLKFCGRDKGLAYFRRLAQQDQIFQRGARGRIQLVAAGEAPLTIGYGPHAQSFVNQGAPIDRALPGDYEHQDVIEMGGDGGPKTTLSPEEAPQSADHPALCAGVGISTPRLARRSVTSS